MKLTILGGGGARIPLLVRAVAGPRPTSFDRVELYEPDPVRRRIIGGLCRRIAAALGQPDLVAVSDDVEGALSGADYVFSAIRVGGDRGRIIDETVALGMGLVGQETTGPGGAAMALRTIPVVLAYAEVIRRVAPHAVVVNFTNPAGIITQALQQHGQVRVVGVCDTPSEAQARIGRFLGVPETAATFAYGGLNHLGWITSVLVDGEDRTGELLARYDQLRASAPEFAAFDAGLVRRVGALPTEYLYYFYDAAAYVTGVAHAGTSRGADVERFNQRLLREVDHALASGDASEAWAAYARVMGARSYSYLRLDTTGQSAAVDRDVDVEPLDGADRGVGGYEGIALRVIDGLSGAAPARVVVNTRNGTALPFLDPDDVVEVPAVIDANGVTPLAGAVLPRGPRGLALQVKEYERGLIEAAVRGDTRTAVLALAGHPLVPGLQAAGELMGAYREQHGADLAYLQ